MKGYWVALYKKINNTNNLKDYSAKVTSVIKSFGGVALVRGGEYQCLEGESAIACHNSKEYQEGWALAKDTTERNFQIIRGFSTE